MSFTLLSGHVSEETCFTVKDYPYGRELRTEKRMWVERAVKGAKKGQERLIYRTYDPKRSNVEAGQLAWNKPHNSGYYDRVYLFTDNRSGYTHFYPISFNGPDSFLEFVATGLYMQLSAEQKKDLADLIEKDKYNGRIWSEAKRVGNVLESMIPKDGGSWLPAEHYFEKGEFGVPGKGWGFNDTGMYLRGFTIIYNALRAELTGEVVLPATRGLDD